MRVFITPPAIVKSFYLSAIKKIHEKEGKLPTVLTLEKIEEVANQNEELKKIRDAMPENKKLNFDLEVILLDLQVKKYFISLMNSQAREIKDYLDDAVLEISDQIK